MIQRLLPVAVLAGIAAVPAFSADLTVEVRGIRSGTGASMSRSTHHRRRTHSPRGKASRRSGRMRRSVRSASWCATCPRDSTRQTRSMTKTTTASSTPTSSGIPTEGYGFTNDPRTTFGPPDFEDAAVNVRDASELAVMTMRY